MVESLVFGALVFSFLMVVLTFISFIFAMYFKVAMYFKAKEKLNGDKLPDVKINGFYYWAILFSMLSAFFYSLVNFH